MCLQQGGEPVLIPKCVLNSFTSAGLTADVHMLFYAADEMCHSANSSTDQFLTSVSVKGGFCPYSYDNRTILKSNVLDCDCTKPFALLSC